MYKKSDHKVKKSYLRSAILKVKNHVKKFVDSATRITYIRTVDEWSGVIPKSTWITANKPSHSKYTPHSGNQERQRRV